MTISRQNQPWGDLGNGFYRNPVLNADFSDPDVIRVGDTFYMVCSDFHYMGIPVLKSKDLVNWTYAGRVYDRMPEHTGYDTVSRYGKGSWAPALRYHDGRFYVYFCTPDEGLFMSSAPAAEGPWEPLHQVSATGWWEDPCPFWDEDGQAYLGRSIVGAGPIIIHKMSSDGRQLLDEGVTVYIGKIAEGTKIYRREDWYYLIIPEGGVETGWQTVLRARSLYGPYEREIMLAQGHTRVNGPHQGALVDTPSGESWLMHFQAEGAMGRVCHLQPVRWRDGWPDTGCMGEPVEVWSKPETGENTLPERPLTSDDFNGTALGLQWQWNHNPVDTAWSLTERPGHLRLYALPADNLMEARNTLTQKMTGRRGEIRVCIDTSGMQPGQQAGLALFCGRVQHHIAVVRDDQGVRTVVCADGVVAHGPRVESGRYLWLGCSLNVDGETCFSFGMEASRLMSLGGSCTLSAGFWKGSRPALFSFSELPSSGYADFSSFHYDVMDHGCGG